MRRGTTPTITLTVDKDVSTWTLYATFRSGMHNVTLENDRMTVELEPATETEEAKTLITVTLTQEETLSLGVGNAEVQDYQDERDGLLAVRQLKLHAAEQAKHDWQCEPSLLELCQGRQGRR